MSARLHMIRADVNMREFQRWAGSRRMIRAGAFDEGYATHCLLKGIYGERAPKPFRLIAPRDARKGVFYGYAEADADELRDLANRFCDPLQASVILANCVQSKAMPDEWREGQRLGFETLVRPVVRSRSPEYAIGARTVEVDAFQYEANQFGKGEMERSRGEVYEDWLRKRLASRGGAELEEASLQSFRRTRVTRNLRGRASEGPEALMRGTLVVGDDSAKFAELLRRGVGRHRAYGFGMLLVRPPKP